MIVARRSGFLDENALLRFAIWRSASWESCHRSLIHTHARVVIVVTQTRHRSTVTAHWSLVIADGAWTFKAGSLRSYCTYHNLTMSDAVE